jgi:putative membrane protein
MFGKTLAYAAVTGLLLGATMGAAPATAQQVSLTSDSLFILRAGSIGLLQAKLGKLAERKGSSVAVVDFGKRMTADYSKANDEIAAAAKQAAYPAPVLLREHKQIADRFNGMSRSSFDKAYMEEVVKHHDEAVHLFRKESESGRVVSLKQLASRMLPDLQRRQSLAAETGSSVGADVTATSAETQSAGGQYSKQAPEDFLRKTGYGSNCHPERSEGGHTEHGLLRFAQGDTVSITRSWSLDWTAPDGPHGPLVGGTRRTPCP